MNFFLLLFVGALLCATCQSAVNDVSVLVQKKSFVQRIVADIVHRLLKSEIDTATVGNQKQSDVRLLQAGGVGVPTPPDGMGSHDEMGSHDGMGSHGGMGGMPALPPGVSLPGGFMGGMPSSPPSGATGSNNTPTQVTSKRPVRRAIERRAKKGQPARRPVRRAVKRVRTAGAGKSSLPGGNMMPISVTGDTTASSKQVTVRSTAGLRPGMMVAGRGIPASTIIAEVGPGSTIRMSNAATESAKDIIIHAINVGAMSGGNGTPSGSHKMPDGSMMPGGHVMPIALMADTKASSQQVTVSTTAGLRPGMMVAGRGIPADTVISEVGPGKTIRMSKAATETVNGAEIHAVELGALPTGITPPSGSQTPPSGSQSPPSGSQVPARSTNPRRRPPTTVTNRIRTAPPASSTNPSINAPTGSTTPAQNAPTSANGISTIAATQKGSNVVMLKSVDNLTPGMPIVARGAFPRGTTILAVDPVKKSVTLSAKAIATRNNNMFTALPVTRSSYIPCSISCPATPTQCGFFQTCGNACYCGNPPPTPTMWPTHAPTFNAFTVVNGNPTMTPIVPTPVTAKPNRRRVAPVSSPVPPPPVPAKQPPAPIPVAFVSPTQAPTLLTASPTFAAVQGSPSGSSQAGQSGQGGSSSGSGSSSGGSSQSGSGPQGQGGSVDSVGSTTDSSTDGATDDKGSGEDQEVNTAGGDTGGEKKKDNTPLIAGVVAGVVVLLLVVGFVLLMQKKKGPNSEELWSTSGRKSGASFDHGEVYGGRRSIGNGSIVRNSLAADTFTPYVSNPRASISRGSISAPPTNRGSMSGRSPAPPPPRGLRSFPAPSSHHV